MFCGDFQINLGANFKDIVNSELNPYFEDTIADKLGDKVIECYEKMIRNYDEAIGINPRDIKTWTYIRISLTEMRDIIREYFEYTNEIIDFSKNLNNVLETIPETAKVWREKGFIFKILGKFTEAIECFNNAIDILPENDKTWRWNILRNKCHSLRAVVSLT